MTSKEIAPLLGLSPHSVDAHIRIAMKVLGVDSRREAALALNEIEATRPARRKPVAVPYEAVDAPTHAHASEAPASAWTYARDGSNLEALQEHPKNGSAMETPVEQSGPTGAVFESISNEGGPLLRLWSNPAQYTANKKVLIILMTALLSAAAFTTIASGFAALSLFFTNENGTK
jgi:hypothetical protein